MDSVAKLAKLIRDTVDSGSFFILTCHLHMLFNATITARAR